jgi:ABC-type branched-subunit amino acid transport system permease subunit
MGGRGTIAGTFVGALLIGVLNNVTATLHTTRQPANYNQQHQQLTLPYCSSELVFACDPGLHWN